MSIKSIRRIFYPVFIAAIALALFALYQIQNDQAFDMPAEGLNKKSEVDKVVLPKPSGSVDGVVDALISDATNEENISLDEDEDASLVNADNLEVSNFDQLYNEDEL